MQSEQKPNLIIVDQFTWIQIKYRGLLVGFEGNFTRPDILTKVRYQEVEKDYVIINKVEKEKVLKSIEKIIDSKLPKYDNRTIKQITEHGENQFLVAMYDEHGEVFMFVQIMPKLEAMTDVDIHLDGARFMSATPAIKCGCTGDCTECDCEKPHKN